MSTATTTQVVSPGRLVKVTYTGIVWRNRPGIDLDITEDGRTVSGWDWASIDRVEVVR